MAIVPKLLIILIAILAIIPIVHAADDNQGILDAELFSFLTGDEGLLARFVTFGEDDYVQYFAALITIAFVVGAATKAALSHGPLGGVLQDDRQRTGVAFIVGIGVANGMFFLLRSVGSIGGQASILWGGFFSLIGMAGMIIIPIWIFTRLGGDGR